MARDVAERDHEEGQGWLQSAVSFFADVRTELRKVTWPQRKEAVAGTIGVIAVVAVITAVLSVVDLTLAKLVELILP
jgi:preprotein translocase subunit SecE